MLARENKGIPAYVSHMEVFQNCPADAAIAEINDLLCVLLFEIKPEKAYGRRVIGLTVNTVSILQTISIDPFVFFRIKCFGIAAYQIDLEKP